MKINRKNDLEYITFDNLEQTGLVKHCFTTRHGGVSTDYWASMNMGFARGEKRGACFCRIIKFLAEGGRLYGGKFM